MELKKPRVLDLCCKAGGISMGFYQAGFEVVGVDIEPQPNYPFEFVILPIGFAEFAKLCSPFRSTKLCFLSFIQK